MHGSAALPLGTLAVGIALGLAAGALVFGGGPLPLDGLGGAGDAGAPDRPGIRTAGSAPASAPAPAPAPTPGGGSSTSTSTSTSTGTATGTSTGTGTGTGTATGAGTGTEPAGAGVITGLVSTEEGRPVAGAVIRGTRMREREEDDDPAPRPRPDAGAPPLPDPDAEAREAVEGVARTRADTVETVTDAEGRYRFAGLADDAYGLQAWAEGYVLRPQGGGDQWNQWNQWNAMQQWQMSGGFMNGRRFGGMRRWRGMSAAGVRVEPGGTLGFVAKRVVAVPVSVRLPDGSAPAKAQLAVSGAEGQQARWRPDDPCLYLTPGAYRVTATVGEHQIPKADEEEFVSAEAGCTVTADGAPPEVVLTCRARPCLKGTVRVPADGLQGGATVRALRLGPDTPPDPQRLRESPSQQAQVQATQPVYVFRDLPAGRYLLGASRGQGTDLGPTVTVDVGDGTTRADLDVPAPAAGRVLVLTALAPDGRPLGDVQVWLNSSGRGQAQLLDRTRTADGGHRLTFAPPDASTPAPADEKWTLGAMAPGYAWKQAELAPGQADVRIEFAEPATVEVRVANYRGSGLEGEISVAIEERPSAEDAAEAQNWWGGGGTALDPEGRCTLSPIEPGDKDVCLYASGGDQGWNGMPIHRTPIAVRAGANAITVTIPPLYKLTVQVDGAAAGGNVGLLRPDAGMDDNAMGWTQLDANGRATFTRLPAGRFRLRVWAENVPPGVMTLTLPAEGVVRYVSDPMDAIRVDVEEAAKDGVLAKAGLRQGDLIVAVNGAGFTSHQAFVTLVTAAMAQPSATLAVRRGTTATEVTVVPKALIEGLTGAATLGGSLTAVSRK